VRPKEELKCPETCLFFSSCVGWDDKKYRTRLIWRATECHI